MKRWIHASTSDDRLVRKALSSLRSDAKKAMKKWHQLGDYEFDRILEDMGYSTSSRNMYNAEKIFTDYSATADINKVKGIINFYGLVVGNDRSVQLQVEVDGNTVEVETVQDIY